ncbi:MAG: phage holin family protein [Rhodocyclaceae bacterium]
MTRSLLERVRRLLGNASALAGTRLGLFSLELQEELERYIQLLALLLAAFLCVALGLLLVAVVALVLAWQSGYLLEVSGGLAVLFVLVALLCALCLRARLRSAPVPFSATVDEFRRDAEALGSSDDEAQADEEAR